MAVEVVHYSKDSELGSCSLATFHKAKSWSVDPQTNVLTVHNSVGHPIASFTAGHWLIVRNSYTISEE